MLRLNAFIVLIAALFLFPAHLYAAGSIGVVDVSHILSQSLAAKNIEAQRQEMREEFRADISEAEQKLRIEEKQLLEDRAKLSPEDYAKKRQVYETKLIEMRKATQEKKRRLDEVSKTSMDALREHLYLVVQSIANERGFELVISNKNVIAGENSLDITQETLSRLNEKVKEIPLGVKGD